VAAHTRTTSRNCSCEAKRHYRANLNQDNPQGTIQSIEHVLRNLDRRAEEEQREIERLEKALATTEPNWAARSNMKRACEICFASRPSSTPVSISTNTKHKSSMVLARTLIWVRSKSPRFLCQCGTELSTEARRRPDRSCGTIGGLSSALASTSKGLSYCCGLRLASSARRRDAQAQFWRRTIL